MREFTDGDGATWTAAVESSGGGDYKGRYHLVLRGPSGEVALDEIRWNSERAALKTLETMSVVELRRRARAALGRTTS